MKSKSPLRQIIIQILASTLLMLILPGTSFAQNNGRTISTGYGPPSAENEWQKFTIPLTAATFDVDEATFTEVMSNVLELRISAEFSGGKDIAGIDDVSLGNRYSSDFNSGLQGWFVSGDGTMEWVSSGGVSGGFLQVSDWASGDWHFATTPPAWAGDWSNLIGDSLIFYVKTNYPEGAAVVEISSQATNRLILEANPLTVPVGGSSNVSVTPNPTTNQDVTVSLSSSNQDCITVPDSVTVSGSQSSGQFTASAAPGAEEGCTSTIVASSSGYRDGRLTLRVGDDGLQAGGQDDGQDNGQPDGPTGPTSLTFGVCGPSVGSPGGGGATSSFDWNSAAVQNCFERWIKEAESRLNAYDGDSYFNANKPWRFNQYGLLEGNLIRSAYAPDNFPQYNNNKYWWMWDFYTAESISEWSKESWRNAGVPALRPYVRQCMGESGASDSVPALGTGFGNSLPIPLFGSTEPALVNQMTLQAGQRRVEEGGLVYVPVWLINGSNVANMNFNLSYDSTVAVPEGEFIPGSLLGSALFEGNSGEFELIRVGFAQTTGLYGTGSITYIPFRAVGRAGDLTGLCLEVTTINTPDGTQLRIDRIQGAIQIVGPDGLVPGDCNNDGALNQYDAFCALQMSVNLRSERLVLDMDNSGDVTSRDATIILQQATRPLGNR